MVRQYIAKRIQFDQQVGMADTSIPELTRILLRGYFLGFKYKWISAPGAMFGAILTIVSPFVRDSILFLQQQLKQQDEGLDMLSKSADRLGALSLGISEELGQQNK